MDGERRRRHGCHVGVPVVRRRLVFLLIACLAAGPALAQQQISSPAPTSDVASSATGSAVPAKATYFGVRENANLTGLIQCDKSAAIAAAAAATTQILALSGSTVIYVCGFSLTGGGAAGTLTWKYGTGSSCGTGTTSISGAYTTAIGQQIGHGGALGYVFKTPAGQALCITMATASAVANGFLSYAQF
jgi:hypothetical protein